MTPFSRSSKLPGWHLTLVAAVAMAFSTGCLRGGSGASPTDQQAEIPTAGSQSPSSYLTSDQPLPVPDGVTIVEVLDPAVASPQIGADDAIELARNHMSRWVGESPWVQLVRLDVDQEGYLEGFVGWILLSPDVADADIGGLPVTDTSAPPPSPRIYDTYTWVWVAVHGEVLGATQLSYENAEAVPPLPR
jgi:hypothetical protein